MREAEIRKGGCYVVRAAERFPRPVGRSRRSGARRVATLAAKQVQQVVAHKRGQNQERRHAG